MSSPEDTELDEYLRGNSDISRRYRAVAEQQPPAALDQAVLAQAREAVQTFASSAASTSNTPDLGNVIAIREQPRRRWIAPFAAAATLLLTFAIFRETGMDRAGGARMPASAGRTVLETDAVSPPLSRAMKDAPESSSAMGVQLDERHKKSEIANSAEKPAAMASGSPSPAVTASKRATTQATDSPLADTQNVTERQPMEPGHRNEAAPAAAAASAPVPVAAPAKAGHLLRTESRAYLARERVAAEHEKDKVANPKSITPEAWLDNIRNLRHSGQNTEAEAELKRFLETYPEYFIKNPAVARP